MYVMMLFELKKKKSRNDFVGINIDPFILFLFCVCIHLGWLLFFSLLTSIKPPSVCLERKKKKKGENRWDAFISFLAIMKILLSVEEYNATMIHTHTN